MRILVAPAKGPVVCVEHGLPRTDQVGGAILSRSRDRNQDTIEDARRRVLAILG
jgi:hypothetical protein